MLKYYENLSYLFAEGLGAMFIVYPVSYLVCWAFYKKDAKLMTKRNMLFSFLISWFVTSIFCIPFLTVYDNSLFTLLVGFAPTLISIQLLKNKSNTENLLK
jgi:hypothetical protein